jgi:outer membrane protein OmpA-like peptidoglycan-associated protein
VGVDDAFNHSFLIGARYAFGVAPAPAPAVAAAPAPARTFLVFFDFNQSSLTDRARSVIAEAANAARTTQTTRIEVSGHTDTVGSAQYNQGLSMRRAESVAGELERRGIPRSQMVLQAFGFTRLLVPTGPNVREPQNRRVEIVLR